jgi:hypothetical protein
MTNKRSATTSALALADTPTVNKGKPAKGVRVVRDHKLARAIRRFHAAVAENYKAMDAARSAQERTDRAEDLLAAALSAYSQEIVVFDGKAYSRSECDDLELPFGADVVHLVA